MIFVLSVVSVNLFSVTEDGNLNRGIVYLSLGDMGQAEKYFNLFFQKGINPALKNGFLQLMEGEEEEAAGHFKSYLDLDHRSSIALVGIALSTAHMAVSNTEEILKRASRLDPTYSPAYISLGVLYQKQRNYPAAEMNFRSALRYSGVPEINILLGRLYIETENPGAALALLKGEADRAPDNFYFNYLTAKAYLMLNRLNELGPYIQAALDCKPKDIDAGILSAKYYLNQNNAQKARMVLNGLKVEDYNEEFMKTYSDVLVTLKDKKARNYLYEVFSRKRWDKDINRLLGLYTLWMVKGGNVQNWIYRSILSGTETARLKELFPDNYIYPEYKSLPFFNVKKVEWLPDDNILAVANQRSGDPERIFIIEPTKMRIVQTISYNGTLQDLFVSKNRNSLVFSTTAREGESVFLYYIGLSNRALRLQPIFGKPLAFPSAAVGFNTAGTLVYITDNRINKLAFESPFSQVSQYGQKTPVFPNYPFNVFQYNVATGHLSKLNSITQSEVVPPIPAVKKYAMVANAYQENTRIRTLIDKGLQLDLTSSESVKIVFSKDIQYFIIYFADLKNAFQGLLWDSNSRNAREVDETMFLGKGNYAELNIVDFNPQKNHLIVLTKNDRDLILYNYLTHIHMNLGSEAFKAYYNLESNMIYVLKQRDANVYFGGAGLQLISLKPYVNTSLGTRMGLTDIIGSKGEDEVYFSTYNGEIVKMDGERKFEYVKPSLENCLHSGSQDGKKTAAFINDRLILIE
jgi:tetratricopeptide (TPR) repeat protein